MGSLVHHREVPVNEVRVIHEDNLFNIRFYTIIIFKQFEDHTFDLAILNDQGIELVRTTSDGMKIEIIIHNLVNWYFFKEMLWKDSKSKVIQERSVWFAQFKTNCLLIQFLHEDF